MTIATTACSVTSIANGVNTAFTFSFEIPYQSDGVTPAVTVFTTTAGVNSLKVLGTDYTIAGVGPSYPTGGTVTFAVAPANLTKVTIVRSLAQTQASAFANEGFIPNNVELALDNLTMWAQEITNSGNYFPNVCTVGTLPSNPTQGQRAFVTDSATTPTFLGTITGGGTISCPVFYGPNGWVAG